MNKIIQKLNIVFIVFSFVLMPSISSADFFQPVAKTLDASSVSQSRARLNGAVSFNDGIGEVWFEFGRNNRLDQMTDKIEVSFGFEKIVSKDINIDVGNYYYRICLRISTMYGTSCGDTKYFSNVPASISSPVASSIGSNNTNQNSGTYSATGSNSSSSSSVKGNTVKNNTSKNNSSKQDNSSLTASVSGVVGKNNFLPNTFLEWLAVISLIFIIVMFGRYLYAKRQEEIEEEKMKQNEASLTGKIA